MPVSKYKVKNDGGQEPVPTCDLPTGMDEYTYIHYIPTHHTHKHTLHITTHYTKNIKKPDKAKNNIKEKELFKFMWFKGFTM